MASFLRVKRKRGDEKLDALLVSCKKRRTHGEEAAELETETAVFTFAGTVKEKHDDIVVNQILSTKEELQSQYKSHKVDIVNKVKEKTKQQSCQNRYKVVNSLRKLDKTEAENSAFNIVDIEDVNTHSDDLNIPYEYDLYYVNDTDLVMDESTKVLEEVIYDYGETNTDEEYVHDSDDSNSESNWRNDYGDNPDGESDGEWHNDSDEEEGLEKMVSGLKIHSDSDLSPSDKDFVYGLEDKDIFTEFKKKHCRNSSDCSDSSDSESKYKDFDDDNDCYYGDDDDCYYGDDDSNDYY